MAWLESFLSNAAPDFRQPQEMEFEPDERHWFEQGVTKELFRFGECVASCSRLRRWKRTIRDEFLTPDGKPRHLFNFKRDDPNGCFLSRENVPHISAVTRLLIEKQFNRRRFAFSRYRTFSRDLRFKKRGGQYETDAEFYDSDGAICLLLEAKKSRREIERLAHRLEQGAELRSLDRKCQKEMEYVLELQPRYLWLVGPALIDPERFVYQVEVDQLNVRFHRIDSLPVPPL